MLRPLTQNRPKIMDKDLSQVVSFIIIIGICMGPVTPPLGISLFAAAFISKAKIEDISKDAIPLVIADIIGMILVILFPVIIKFLPRVLGYAV